MTLSAETRQQLKKLASTSTDDRQVETAFADMVSVAVGNKAGPLLNGGRHLGFEIVKKNDENTHMLGVSVFRLGTSGKDDLVYAPAIFTGGKVVCTSLLYRVGAKKFVPFKPEWCQFLMDLSSRSTGKPMHKTETNKLMPMTNWHLLSTPPNNIKSASLVDMQDVNDMLGLLEKRAEAPAALREFMVEAGPSALQILLNTVDVRPKFAKALAYMPEDTFMPPEMLKKVADERLLAQTQRALDNMPTLALITGAPDVEVCKAAGVTLSEGLIERLTKKGYSIDPVLDSPLPEVKTVAYEGSMEDMFVSPGTPGQAKMLVSGNKLIDVVVGNTQDAWELFERGCYPLPLSSSSWVDTHRPNSLYTSRVAVALDEPLCFEGNSPLYLVPGVDEGLDTVGQSLGDIETPGLFALVDPVNNRLTRPVWLDKKEKGEDGVVTFTGAANAGGEMRTLLFNPTLQRHEVLQNAVLGPAWRAVRIKYKKGTESKDNMPCCVGSSTHGGAGLKQAPSWEMGELTPAASGDVRRYLESYGSTMKSASIEHDRGLFEISVKGVTIAERRMGAAVKLAALGLEPARVEELLDVAEAKAGKLRLSLDFSKSAGALQIADSPRWQQQFDSIQQVPLNVPQSFVLRTTRAPVILPAPRIGDHLRVMGATDNQDAAAESRRHEVPESLIMNGTPDEIFAHSQEIGASHAFDHAVLGSLARTYDSAKLLEGYIPKLEDGVDAMGRSLFLFYWRPEDWRNLYGLDDLTDIEQKLTSVFENAGDVVLDLLKKTRTAAA